MTAISSHNEDAPVIDDNLEVFSLIWLDANFKTIKRNRSHEKKLRGAINYLKKFQDIHTCQRYIEQRPTEARLVLIVSDELGQKLLPRVHQLRQFFSTYVYCTGKKMNEEWTSKFSKVRLSV
jgi:hypothetical protein